MPHLVSFPVLKGDGYAKVVNSEDADFVARWIDAENRPGRGVFSVMNPLKAGATWHSKELAGILHVYVDIDLKDIEEEDDYVALRLRTLPLQPSWIHRSGHGYHVGWTLREMIARDDEGYEAVVALQAKLIEWAAADRLVRPWTVLRLPGTTNFKHEPYVPCEVIATGLPVDIAELQAMCELVEGVTLFTRKAKPEDGAEHNQYFDPGYREPVNVEERLQNMTYKGPGDSAIRKTQLQVTASLIRGGMSLEAAVLTVLEETQKAAPPDWDWDVERLDLERQCYDWVTKHPELSSALPEGLRDKFEQLCREGVVPRFTYRPDYGGWQCKYPHGKKQSLRVVGGTEHPEEEAEGETSPPPRPRRFKLVSFADLRPGPEPLYLVDELIPVAGLVDVWGKAKCYKSFWTLDLMLHVAMGWEYRDRYVRQGPVVYCAFEGAHGYKKRVEALRRHYNMDAGADVPLYVMPGQANLITEHKLLIQDIAEQLGAVTPVVVVLDTLNKSLVGSENKDVDMGAYVRAAEAIRDKFGCVVVIVHHCGYDDTRPRGHSSLPGAVDAQLAVARNEEVVTVTVEMMRDGPEELQVVSEAQSVEVGQDQNGKILTSLVMVPSDADPASAGHGMARGLNVFYSALKAALASDGEQFQPEAGVLPVRAVPQFKVRDRFYKTYAEAEEDAKKRQAKMQKAFVRALSDGQSRGLFRTRRTDFGEAMLWLPERGEK